MARGIIHHAWDIWFCKALVQHIHPLCRRSEQKFQQSFSNVCKHVHVKRIQGDQFEEDKENCKARVLKRDFAMGYEYEYQNEVQWSVVKR